MDRNRDFELGSRESGGCRALQPVVAERELDEFGQLESARRLARLEADTELMFRLSIEGFEGSAWREVSGALIDYGFQVMRAWIVTGQVFGKMAAKGRRVPDPPGSGIPREDALVLASDTVADAIVDFRDRVLKRGLWNASKGASLTTYFIGNCLIFQFPNLYRSWRREYLRSTRQEALQNDGERDHPALIARSKGDPAQEVVSADHTERTVREILEPIRGETNRAILLLRSEGFGVDEIAEALDLEYAAVESRLYRARQKIRQRRSA